MKKRFSLLLAIVMVIAMVLPMLPVLSVPTVAAEAESADDVVIEVYVGEETTPNTTIKRSEVPTKITEYANGKGTNVVSNLTKAGNNVRVEIVKPFTMPDDPIANGKDREGYSFGVAANGKTVTINGNNNQVTSLRTGGQRCTWWNGNASSKIILNDFNLYCDTGSSVMQYYGGVTMELNDCTLISTKHKGFFLTSNGVLNINGNTYVEVAQEAIVGNASNNTVTIGENATVVSTGAAHAVTITKSNLNVILKGTLVQGSNAKNAVNQTNGSFTVEGGAVVGNVNTTGGTATLTSGYCSGTVTGATPGANFVTGAVAGIGAQGYTTIADAFAAATTATSDVTVKVLKDVTVSATPYFKNGVNVVIEGIPVNGVNPKITTGDYSNKFKFEGTKTYTLKNLDIVNAYAKGCLVQLVGGNLNIEGCNITTAEQYNTVNLMATDGSKQIVNIKDSTITQTAAGNGVIVTGNDGANDTATWRHYNHAIVNIDNSTINGQKAVVNVTKGSTADITVTGSDLANATGEVIYISTPQFLKGESATIGASTCSADGYSDLVPATGFLKVKYDTASDKITVNVKEKTLAMIGDVEYTTYDAAFAAAAAAKEDVTVKLVADGVVGAMVEFKGTANVTIDGDPDGDGVCAKLTTTHGSNNFRWYTAGKTLTFKNIDMTVNASGGCVFQLGYNGATSIALDNVKLEANVKYHVVNVMSNDGKTSAVSVNNSTVTTNGNFISTGNNDAHDHNLDLDITKSDITADKIVVICNNPSTVDLDVVDSDLTSKGANAIDVAGTGEGSSVYVDNASTITVPEGKKIVNATAPKTDVNTPWDIVMTISTVEGETKTLVQEIMRKDVNSALSETGSNPINVATKAGKNVVVDILMPFDVSAQMAFYAYEGTIVTVNGNDHKISSTQSGGGRMLGFLGGTGKVVVNNLYIDHITDKDASVAQMYHGITVDFVDCQLLGSLNHNGFWITQTANVNLLGNTTLTAGGTPIIVSGAGSHTTNITIGEDATVTNTKNGAAISITGASSNAHNMTISGTVNGATAISCTTASANVVLDGATIDGPITMSNGTVEIDTAMSGALTVSGGNVTLVGGTFAGTANVTGGKLTVDGATVTGNITAAEGTYDVANGTVVSGNTTSVTVDGVTVHYVNEGDKAELEGAEVRLRNDYSNGLRFVNVISKDLVDALKALAADGEVNYGTIVLPKEYFTKYSLTVVTHKTLADIAVVDIPASNGLTIDAEGNVVISSALVEIKGSHYDWEFVSIVYASYTDANGDTVYVYGDNTAETLVAKSVKSVSEAALADTQKEAGGEYRFPYNGAYTKYSPSKIAVLEGFAGLREMPEAPSTPVNPDRPEVHSHKYTEVVTAPTCFEPGYTTYTCSCGHSYTGAETDPAHDAITHVAALAATCDENGNIEYWFCETCGSAWLDEACMLNTNLKAVVLPATGHADEDCNGKCDVCENYFLPAAGEAFKLQLVQAKLGKTLYFTGKMSGYYYATGDYNAAVDVYIEDAEGGFNMYFLDGETKNYLYVVASGTYINVKYGATNEGNVWTFNEELGSLETVVDGTDYYIGTYNTYNTISASKTSYVNSGNVDKEQFVARAISFAGHEHSYSEATCTKLATCVCGLTTGELADHAYGEGVPTDPTCTAAGYTTYTCGTCSGTKKVDGEAALGHTTENGTCDRCGEEIGGEVAEPTLVMDITKDDFNSTSYAANNNQKTDGGYKFTSNQVMNQAGIMQWQKNNGYITFDDITDVVKLEISVSAGTFTVTVGGQTVTGTQSGNVTTYDLTGLTGVIKISVGGATGKVDYIHLYK